ncbi:MAG: orotidine-5'-phosphate decarboxylase [Microthrixaceae bacterium]
MDLTDSETGGSVNLGVAEPNPADDAPEEPHWAPPSVRNRLCLVLDVDDMVMAERTAVRLMPYFGVAKVGLELYSAAGPQAVSQLTDLGYDVFVDLKLHDIPTTVGRASRVLGALGASYLTLHAHGGTDMLRAGVEGLAEGAANAGQVTPQALAVTVLSSDSTAPPHIAPARMRLAMEAGCQGLVLAAEDLHDAFTLAPRMTRVVPGIRPAGSDTHDQARSATPAEAIAGGADVLVIGRAVTHAADPEAAADAIANEVAGALGR